MPTTAHSAIVVERRAVPGVIARSRICRVRAVPRIESTEGSSSVGVTATAIAGNNLEFLLGRDPGHDIGVAQHPGAGRAVGGGQFVAGDDRGVLGPAEVGGDGVGGLRVVAGQHDRPYARLAQSVDQVGRGLPGHVGEGRQAHELQVAQRLFEYGLLVAVERAPGHRQDARAVPGRRLGAFGGLGGQDGLGGALEDQTRGRSSPPAATGQALWSTGRSASRNALERFSACGWGLVRG